MHTAWVLTGVGLVTAVGDSPDALFSALLEGTPAPHNSGSLPAAAIAGFDPKQYIDRKGLKYLSRTSQLACVAAALLGKNLEGLKPSQIGVLFGSAWAALDSIVQFEREAHTEGPRFVDPLLFTETVANVPAGQISIFNGWSACNVTFSEGSGSGMAAICRAIQFLDEGRCELAVAGGGDGINLQLLKTLHPEGPGAEFAAAGAPFSGSTRAPLGGEGACLFSIESSAGAQSRGARPLGQLLASLSRFAGTDLAAGRELRAAWLRELLENAELAAEQIDLVVLSGNGNPLRDRAEAATLRDSFGAALPPLVLPKAVIGECWAAAGPLGVAIALEAMRKSTIPALPRQLKPAAEYAALNFPREKLRHAVQRALVLDCAESGQFSGLIIAAPGEQ